MVSSALFLSNKAKQQVFQSQENVEQKSASEKHRLPVSETILSTPLVKSRVWLQKRVAGVDHEKIMSEWKGQ